MPRLSGRIALVTGASRGIGAAVARRLAAEGAHVVLTARTVGGLEEVDDRIRRETGERATLVPLDLRKADEIDRLGYAIYERFGRLDVLVGNAGVLETLGPVATFDPKLFERIMTVNVTANARLIRTTDRMLRASDAGRAVFVTTSPPVEAHPYWGPYAASKAALEVLVRTWAAEVAASPLRVNLIDPGTVATKLRLQAFPGEDQSALRQPDEVAGAFLDLTLPACTRHGEVVRVG